MDFTTHDLKTLFATLADRMARERDALCALDGAVGDGDHGIAMEQGMIAASRAVHDLDGTLQDMWTAAAKGFLNAVGASAGPLYATGFLRAAKVCGPEAAMPRDHLRQVIAAIRDGIMQRGKAAPGQKSMVDVWTPAADAALAGATPDAILTAAGNGVAATAAMVAKLGRAARLGARSLGHPDPGAASAAMVVDEIVRFLR